MSKNKIMQRLSIDKQHELVVYLVASSANVFAFLPQKNPTLYCKNSTKTPRSKCEKATYDDRVTETKTI